MLNAVITFSTAERIIEMKDIRNLLLNYCAGMSENPDCSSGGFCCC